jgi:hypothetical protein
MDMKGLNGTQIVWLLTHDRNKDATKLADRHYSRKHVGATEGFVGPGEKIVLMTPDCRALFVWMRCNPKFRLDNQTGINCTIFRNEGPVLSSKLILEAEKWCQKKWPNEKRLFTYVKKSQVRSAKPRWCFIKAGWREIGANKSGKLIILEKVLA